MAVHDADQPRWADGNTWACYQCNEYKNRVVVINGDYFCAECLMTAVIKGQLKLDDRRCADCDDLIEGGSSVYCESCYTDPICSNCGGTMGKDESYYCGSCYESTGSSQYCASCGDERELYCKDCAESEWGLGPCDNTCGECGDTPHEYTYCWSCMSNVHGCTECSSLDVTVRLCANCERTATTQAAQAVETLDGNEFTFDDGIVVRFSDGG